MNGSTKVLAGVAALIALAAPVRAQLQGREIDLNQRQGWLGYEQSEWFVVEGPPPKGWGGWNEAPKGFPKPPDGDDKFGKPDDQVTGLTDDPSEQAALPGQKPEDNEPKDEAGSADFQND